MAGNSRTMNRLPPRPPQEPKQRLLAMPNNWPRSRPAAVRSPNWGARIRRTQKSARSAAHARSRRTRQFTGHPRRHTSELGSRRRPAPHHQRLHTGDPVTMADDAFTARTTDHATTPTARSSLTAGSRRRLNHRIHRHYWSTTPTAAGRGGTASAPATISSPAATTSPSASTRRGAASRPPRPQRNGQRREVTTPTPKPTGHARSARGSRQEPPQRRLPAPTTPTTDMRSPRTPPRAPPPNTATHRYPLDTGHRANAMRR